jgi:hypothetical protein
MLDKKVSPVDIGRELTIHSFFLGEIVTQAGNFSTRELRKIFDEFYRCDVASKSGGQSYALMHRLTIGICTGTW